MTARVIEVAQIARMLAERTPSLVAELLPRGRKEANEWRVGSVAGEPGRSMAVHLSGHRAGVWCDFGGRPEDRGDALDLVAAVLFNGEKKRAIPWARAWLGLDGVDYRRLATHRRAIEEHKREAAAQDRIRRERALGLFLAARERIGGTPAETYLKGRGIDFARLGRQPGSLRFAPGLADPETGVLWPTLIAAITGPDHRICAVHRTFLEVQRDGRVSKAPLDDPKMTLGRYAGGCIRLWRGASGKPMREAQPGEWVIVGEGIEDTASAVMACPDYRAVCAVSLANIGSLWLPDAIAGVILLGQNDEADSPAAHSLTRAIAHFHDMGKRVRLARPTAGTKDLNDVLTKGDAA